MTARRLTCFLLLCAFLSACSRSSTESGSSGRPHSVTIKWVASTSSVSGYRIYRSTDPNASPGFLAATGPQETQFVDKSVEAGRTYYYSVKSFNSAGGESVAAMISATVPADTK